MGAELTTKCLAFSDNHQLLGWEPRPVLRPLRKCSPGLLPKAAASLTLFSETREKSLPRKASFELPIHSLEAIAWVWLPSALGTFQVVSRERGVLREGLDKPDVLPLCCDITSWRTQCKEEKVDFGLWFQGGSNSSHHRGQGRAWPQKQDAGWWHFYPHTEAERENRKWRAD